MKTPNLIRAALALAVVAALAAACGVANPFAPAAANTSRQDQLLKWAQCMRQHGVNVPDPQNGRISVQGSGGPVDKANGPDPNNSQFQAAQDACKQYQPNAGNGNGQPTQQEIDQATKFSQCMRQHGIDFPDPQVGSGGIEIRITPGPNGPPFDPNSDQFKQAQQACSKYAPGGGTGGGGTGTNRTSGG